MSAASNSLEMSLRKAKSALTTAEAANERDRESALAQMNRANTADEAFAAGILSASESSLKKVREIELSAMNHIRAQGADVGAVARDDSRPVEEVKPTLEECVLERDRLQALHANIVALKPLAYWPRNPTAGFALAALLIASIWLYGIGLLWFVVVYFARGSWVRDIDVKYGTLASSVERLEARLRSLRDGAERELREARTRSREAADRACAEIDGKLREARAVYGEESAKAVSNHATDVAAIEDRYRSVAQELAREVSALWNDCGIAGWEWSDASWQTWAHKKSVEPAARLGRLQIAPARAREYPRPLEELALPALTPFCESRSIVLRAAGAGKSRAADAILSVVTRILATVAPGKARFTFIDPVGLGQNAADFMLLGDHNRELISGKAWSEPNHIEHQLTVLTEHIETVIQTCLRNEFATLLEYNRAKPDMAQPFRFAVIHDFPVNFTESAARRLASVVKNGPRCGVYAILVRDTEKKLPSGVSVSDIEGGSLAVDVAGDSTPLFRDSDFDGFELSLDGRPGPHLTRDIVKRSAELSLTAMKIDVPFAAALEAAGLEERAWWSADSTDGLTIPLGPAGARSVQELALGGGQEAHGLLVGRTGSGKTNLMHVIVTALALKYPAREIELYLIDFKGGVGFKRYAEHRLPHARVVAIESEREFGISVLRGLDAELKRRSEMFRAAGVDSLGAYRAKARAGRPDSAPLPRVLLIVDEFQEFFSENDDLAQQAKMIFERLARQGRSFGIHFLLATQSLSGSAQLPASIMGQIKVRIALPCSEADSRLILADDNKAARALSQAGEAIYNPMGGAVEGNNRFQVARFADEDLPRYLRAAADSAPGAPGPTVFEGNELADLAGCSRLATALAASAWNTPSSAVDLLLGEPIALMPPVAATLRRQSGRNLLALTREEREGVGMCIAAILSVLSQQPPAKRRVYVADFSTADSEWANYAPEIAKSLPGELTLISRQRDLAPMLASVAKLLSTRDDYVSGQCSVYLFIIGLHRAKALRDDSEDDQGNNAVELLKTILQDGPEVGVHTVAWADTLGNATRGLDRRAMREFGLRVAAVMDSGDSVNFLDSTAASKIAKPHRAIFCDEDRPGQLETFRPYALPPAAWLKHAGQRLRGRPSVEQPQPQS